MTALRVGIVKEVLPGETRVAATPNTVEKLIKLGFDVSVEPGAGAAATSSDESYQSAGARLAADAADVWHTCDIIAKFNPPGAHPTLGHEADAARKDQLIIAMLSPATNSALLEKLASRGVTAFSMDCIPRISRAQRMDVLSSMANIAGYRAVVEASNAFGSFFTGQTTAAGSVKPAKVLIIGAGVAGLASLGAARSLGAIVRAFDTRAAVKEQVESLGGEFLTVEVEESGEGKGGYAKVMSQAFIDAEMALFREQAVDIDIVITTALIPGKKAPVLWTEDMVKSMKPGSVVVDLAARNGGNCELTESGKSIVAHGVTIVGYEALPRRMPKVASELFGTNLAHFFDELGGNENFNIDHDNQVIRGALVLEHGESNWPPPKIPDPSPSALPAKAPEPEVKAEDLAKDTSPPKESRVGATLIALVALIAAVGWTVLRFTSGADALDASTQLFLQHLTVFVLACFVGWQVVWSVSAALHTPLMSVTNAISGIIVIGGILQGRTTDTPAALYVGAAAILFATINIFGGFFVTQRMLQMFRK